MDNGSPGARQSSADIAYRNHVTAIKEAVDSGNIRSYGSPVMSLKETIDEHFKNGHISSPMDYRKSAPEEYYRLTDSRHGPQASPPTSRSQQVTVY